MIDLKRCAIHTLTNKPWSLAECCDAYVGAGIGGISIWRDVVQTPADAERNAAPGIGRGPGLAEAAKLVQSSGLRVPAYVRGGFFPAVHRAARQAAIDDNKRCLDEAATLGAEQVVLVVGAVPGMTLQEARKQVTDGIVACLEHADKVKVKLSIEPLHPMYVGDKSCINRMAEARAVCEQLDHPMLGIAVDVYHVWWDPDLESEIELAGEQGTIFGFHVCDWRLPTRDLLTDRGLMGDGCIDVPRLRSLVENAGFGGMIEVEVFSEDYWAMDQHVYLDRIIERFRSAT